MTHRFHRTGESLREAGTLVGDLIKVHPLACGETLIQLFFFFLHPPSPKSLKSLWTLQVWFGDVVGCEIAPQYSSGRRACLPNFQGQSSTGSYKERASLRVLHHSLRKGLSPVPCPYCGQGDPQPSVLLNVSQAGTMPHHELGQVSCLETI